MPYCYCLFCETNKCKKAAFLLERNGIDRAFSPQIVKRQRKNGKNIDMLFDLLPGYVFAYHSERITEPSLLKTDGVIRILGSADDDYCLDGNDLSFANALLERNGVIDVMRILRVGDKVMLSEPLFFGVEGSVVKIDYRKQRAKVEFPFAGALCSTWVACEVVNSTLLE